MNSSKLSKDIKLSCLRMIYESNASHIGSALSIADILSVLYADIMQTFPENPNHPNRDRFILSKGHAASILYALLGELKYFEKAKLSNYGKNGDILMNHVSHKIPGVEFSTGSLGHGLSFGAGKALAAKKKGETWNTYVLMSDGELQEGSIWEALMFSAHHKLDNIVAIIDYNKLQSLKSINETLNIEPLKQKFASFGWHVLEVEGHDHKDLKKTFFEAKKVKNKPQIIIANTVKGKGVSFMENSIKWHYKTPNKRDYLKAIQEVKNA